MHRLADLGTAGRRARRPVCYAIRMLPRAESTPTITRPDLEQDRDATPKALRPRKLVALAWTKRADIPQNTPVMYTVPRSDA
jgi:hypothetical protein